MEIGIYVQVTTCTDISVAERAGGLSERLEMVSSSEQVSVGMFPGRHSVALHRCTENRIETPAASLTQTNACSYTDKQLQQQYYGNQRRKPFTGSTVTVNKVGE